MRTPWTERETVAKVRERFGRVVRAVAAIVARGAGEERGVVGGAVGHYSSQITTPVSATSTEASTAQPPHPEL